MNGRFNLERRSVTLVLTAITIMMLLCLGACGKKTQDSELEGLPDPATEETVTVPPNEIAPVEEEIVEPVEEQVVRLDLKPVFFGFDKHNLGSDARDALNSNGRQLKEHKNVRITIEGHCDERGTVQYNMALGEKRARAARDYLVNLGVERSRIEIVSFGKERPFDPGHSESAWAKNRRAHFVQR